MSTFKSESIHKATITTFVKLLPGMNYWEHRWRIYLKDDRGWVKKVADTKITFIEGKNEPILECKMPKVAKLTEYQVLVVHGDGLFLIGRWYIGSPRLIYQGTEKVTLVP